MSGKTKIEWADRVWNPVTGCTPVSEGCRNCYAKKMALRLRGRYGYPEVDPFAVTVHPEHLEDPRHWKKPCRIFVCSMGDLFHPNVPDRLILHIMNVIKTTPQKTYLLLTKRSHRMKDFFSRLWQEDGVLWLDGPCKVNNYILNNVWIGVSAEDQNTANIRIPLLMQIHAKVRFVSVEPMLGPINLEKYLSRTNEDQCEILDARQFSEISEEEVNRNFPKLDWVICGGETGTGARPVHPDWVRGLRDQCIQAKVPFFFKQWGEWAHSSQIQLHQYLSLKDKGLTSKIWNWPDARITSSGKIGKKNAGRLLDGKVWEEYPEEG